MKMFWKHNIRIFLLHKIFCTLTKKIECGSPHSGSHLELHVQKILCSRKIRILCFQNIFIDHF